MNYDTPWPILLEIVADSLREQDFVKVLPALARVRTRPPLSLLPKVGSL